MDMEKYGVSIDEKILNKLSEKFEVKIKSIEKSCFEIVGEEFNLGLT
jgi:DNA polymerase I-like protein with 3'-5' exonuclease and polymerase domains